MSRPILWTVYQSLSSYLPIMGPSNKRIPLLQVQTKLRKLKHFLNTQTHACFPVTFLVSYILHVSGVRDIAEVFTARTSLRTVSAVASTISCASITSKATYRLIILFGLSYFLYLVYVGECHQTVSRKVTGYPTFAGLPHPCNRKRLCITNAETIRNSALRA